MDQEGKWNKMRLSLHEFLGVHLYTTPKTLCYFQQVTRNNCRLEQYYRSAIGKLCSIEPRQGLGVATVYWVCVQT